MCQVGLRSHPFEQFYAIYAAHFEVQENQRRHRIAATIRIDPRAAEISHCHLRIDGAEDPERDPGFAYGRLEQVAIVEIIFNVQ